nr:MAG TPA: hypothetical protein [Caudoviricetes sp.]
MTNTDCICIIKSMSNYGVYLPYLSRNNRQI